LRARGAPAADPVRWRFLEALARRAATHDGAARQLLDERLAAHAADFAAALDAASAPAAAAEAPPRPARPGPLAELARRLAHLLPGAAPARAPATAGATTTPPATPSAEPEVLAYARRTWSRLSADQRLAQSRATLPENAGPLNSHHLVHRALAAMREVSPEYLERFVAQVDALLGLEQANAAAGEAPLPARPGKTRPR
jgi:hypothetical protein